MLLVNLRMDATYIKEGMNISWVSEVRTGQIRSKDIQLEYNWQFNLFSFCFSSPIVCYLNLSYSENFALWL